MKLISFHDASRFFFLEWKHARVFSYIRDFFDGVPQEIDQEIHLPASIESMDVLQDFVEKVVKPFVDVLPIRNYAEETIPIDKANDPKFLTKVAEVPEWLAKLLGTLTMQQVAEFVKISDFLGFEEFKRFGCYYFAWVHCRMTFSETEDAFPMMEDYDFIHELYTKVMPKIEKLV